MKEKKRELEDETLVNKEISEKEKFQKRLKQEESRSLEELQNIMKEKLEELKRRSDSRNNELDNKIKEAEMELKDTISNEKKGDLNVCKAAIADPLKKQSYCIRNFNYNSDSINQCKEATMRLFCSLCCDNEFEAESEAVRRCEEDLCLVEERQSKLSFTFNRLN